MEYLGVGHKSQNFPNPDHITTTTTKSIATHTKDFCEKNLAKSPDFKELFPEIAIVRQ